MSEEDKYIQNYLNQNQHIEDFWLEAPYNSYGSRGFVDAVMSWEPAGDDEPHFYEIVEVKSEAAIREATGANEIIRQVNKMAAYFIEGQEEDIVDTENHRFRLDIIDTEYTRQHLVDNFELYKSVHDEDSDLTPGISVRLVSQEGLTRTSLHNLKDWAEDGEFGDVDIRNPDIPSPISLIDDRKEPEDETFCYRHGLGKRRSKPMFKLGGQHYVAKAGYKLFYCPKCVVEILASNSDSPWETIHRFGGLQETALWMLTAPAVESEDISDVFGGKGMWKEVDGESEAVEHMEGEMLERYQEVANSE